MIDIEELEQSAKAAGRFTEGETTLKISDVKYEDNAMFTNRDTGQLSSGDRVTITFQIMSGPDTGRTFPMSYGLGHPQWGAFVKKQYLNLVRAVFSERLELLEKGKDPINLLHRTLLATLYYDNKTNFVRMKNEQPVLNNTGYDIDDNIPF